MRDRGRPVTHSLTLLSFLLMGLTGTPLTAAAQTVRVLCCVKPGVESRCLVITDRTTGKSYEIGSAVPRPDPQRNLVVDLKGEIFQGMSICMEGTILKQITWNYTTMSCRRGE